MGLQDGSKDLDYEQCLLKEVGEGLTAEQIETILFVLEGENGRVKLHAAETEAISNSGVPWIALMRRLRQLLPDMQKLMDFLETMLLEIKRKDLADRLRMRRGLHERTFIGMSKELNFLSVCYFIGLNYYTNIRNSFQAAIHTSIPVIKIDISKYIYISIYSLTGLCGKDL